MTSLLTIFGLRDRICDGSSQVFDIALKPIDWNYVDKVLQEWRLRTDNFFKFINDGI